MAGIESPDHLPFAGGRQADGIEPKLADLRDSGSIEQDADVRILLHRDTTKYRTDDEEQRKEQRPGNKVIMAKNRNGETGSFSIAFVRNIVRFEDLVTTRPYTAAANLTLSERRIEDRTRKGDETTMIKRTPAT